MTQQLTLSVQKREGLGKGANRKLRTTGLVPGIFYNAEGKNVSVAMSAKELDKVYSSVRKTTYFNLDIEGDVNPCLIWKLTYHPVKGTINHVDFYGVDLNKVVKIRVPLIITGVAKGTKVGGKMEVFREFIFVEAKPADLPSKVTIDVTEMNNGDNLRVADLQLPEGVQAIYSDNFMIVSVAMERAEKAAEEA